jgi:hypothetical protein
MSQHQRGGKPVQGDPCLTRPACVPTLSSMQRLLRVSVALPLAALALVTAAGPAAAPASLAPSWYLPAVLALGAATIWRRPRRVVVVVLVLVLCVFAFENALHSVHHGLDPKQQEACTIAAAAAQLAAVPVDGIAPASLLLFAAAQAAEPAPTFSLIRFLSPDQGRAPPSAIL